MIQYNIRIGLVARICRSQSPKGDQFRQGRGSIPRFGKSFLLLIGLAGGVILQFAEPLWKSA